MVWFLFEFWWQPHHPVATSSRVSLRALGIKGYFFFPSKPGVWLCHLCPLLPILWRIMNSHYIKLNRFLPCLLSMTAFHSRRVISICSHPIQQTASHLVAQTAWPQASHPVCWGTIHHTGGQDPNCFRWAVGSVSGRKALNHCLSPYLSSGQSNSF